MTIITRADIITARDTRAKAICEAEDKQAKDRKTLKGFQNELTSLKGQLEVIDPSLVKKPRSDSSWSIIQFVCSVYYSVRAYCYRGQIAELKGRVSKLEGSIGHVSQEIDQAAKEIRSANQAFDQFKQRLEVENDRLKAELKSLDSLQPKSPPTDASNHYWITNLLLVPFRAVQNWRALPPAGKGSASTQQERIDSLSAQIEANKKLIEELTIPLRSRELIESFDRCWNPTTKKYEGIVYDEKAFIKHLEGHNQQFPCNLNPKTDFGFIEKKDLPAGTKIFVRADLHGDLKSLMENLKTLQKQGLLDGNFKCRPDVQLVFLGDYADRGQHSIQVLELLTTLRMENPTQVTLIRGNHEDIETNINYAIGDQNFVSFISDPDHRSLLTDFYQTLPLTVYMAEIGDRRQYTQFTHGTFEVYVDPAEMLASPDSSARMAVPRYSPSLQLSSRVQLLANRDLSTTASKKESKQIAAAKTVDRLWKNNQPRTLHDPTVYNWGDVGPSTSFRSIGRRQWQISPEDVKHCLRAMSPSHPVKMIFRGHEHKKHHWIHNNKIVVSTMPVGMDSAGYANRFPGQADTGYILTLAPKVKDWKKQAYQRASGSSDVTVSTETSIRDQAF